MAVVNIRQNIYRHTPSMGRVIRYHNRLVASNMSHLPAARGCNYLVCITGLNSEIVAKRWARKAPVLSDGEIVITFTDEAQKQALQVNKINEGEA